MALQGSLRAALLALALVGCSSEAAPPARAQATVVHGITAEQGDVYAWVYGQGSAVAVRRKALYFQSTGKVSYLARGPDGGELRPGDKVKGPENEELLGELLAKVDDRDQLANIEASRAELQRTRSQALTAEAQLKSAQAELAAAKRELKRAEQLVASGAGNTAEVDNAKTRVSTAKAAVASSKAQIGSARSGSRAQAAAVRASKVAQERAAIFAPFDGVVAALNIKEGDYVLGAQASADPSEQLRTAPLVVVDPSEFELAVELPAYEASRLEVGQPAFVLTGEDVAALTLVGSKAVSPEGLSTRGEVFSVSPAVDPSARSILVKIRVKENPERLRDGDFVSAFIMVNRATDVVSIPFDAFVRDDDVAFAFVVPEGSTNVERRLLELGLAGVEHVEVKKGILAGELVVTRGRRSLGDGSQVDVAKIDDKKEETASDPAAEDEG